MVDREVWEDSVKYLRRKYLDKTHDMEHRLTLAGMIDAFSDDLYETLEKKEQEEAAIEQLNQNDDIRAKRGKIFKRRK